MTQEFYQYTAQENSIFETAIPEADRPEVSKILKAAETIIKSLRTLSSTSQAGFVLAITQRGNLPVMTQKYGQQIEDPDHALVYAHLNIQTVVANPNFISSSEVNPSPDHIGAVAFDKWILSVRGFRNPQMNAAVAIGIAFGAGLINYQKAEELARNPHTNCINAYMENEEALTGPFLSERSTSRDPLLPPQDI